MYIPFLSIHWILFIHLSMMDVWVAFIFWVLLKMFLEYGCTDHLFITLLSVPLGIHPALQLLDHMVILFLIFGETVTLFSTVTAPHFVSVMLWERKFSYSRLQLRKRTVWPRMHMSIITLDYRKIEIMKSMELLELGDIISCVVHSTPLLVSKGWGVG